MKYVEENEKVSRKNIVENLNLTEGQIKYYLKTLKEKEKIDSIGRGKNTYYVIKDIKQKS